MTDTIYAYTPCGSDYPPYLNIRRPAPHEGYQPGTYLVTVRERRPAGVIGTPPSATIAIGLEEFRGMCGAFGAELDRQVRHDIELERLENALASVNQAREALGLPSVVLSRERA